MTSLRMLTATILVGLAVPLAGQARALGIKGSVHDFSAETWNFRQEICRVCHVPHDHDRAFKRGAAGLLWNHALSKATYTMYSSDSIQGAQDSQPTGVSKMCLGCHDGTVGLDAFDKNPDTPTSGTYTFIQDADPGFRTPGANYWNAAGTVGDLGSTHPLSIVYDESADPGLRPKTTTMGTSGTIADVLEGGTKVQCSSCHDVHDQDTVVGTHLLRVGTTVAKGGLASGLCLVCHDK